MSHVSAQIRTVGALLQAIPSAQTKRDSERDAYWTLVCYFNSLRELGHAATLVHADIREYINFMWHRKGIKQSDEFDPRRFIRRSLELTSRISSSQIPHSLQELEKKYPAADNERPVDICLATNMISVGVDVQRLGLMAVVGQPKTTSEYIQATSRVGRSSEGPGLVVVIYSTGKPRDRSHYEHFRTYHASLYRQVEPTSVTPFAPPVCERALHALIIGFVRYLGKPANSIRPQPFPEETLLHDISSYISERIQSIDSGETERSLRLLRHRIEHWKRVLPPKYGDFSPPEKDLPLMYPAGSEPHPAWDGKSWPMLTSMRNVDATTEARVIGQYPDLLDEDQE
jgi:hypothetical protein